MGWNIIFEAYKKNRRRELLSYIASVTAFILLIIIMGFTFIR
jgi:hypothetical protein